jgi:ribosomal protein S18 acetylase RimI-like enzyme
MIEYRDARFADGPVLGRMAERSFLETFAHLYSKADGDAFVHEAFGPGGLPSHIGKPEYKIRLAFDGTALAGFAKIGRCTLPAPAPADAIELKQLYVLRPWQGAGVAVTLMDWTIATARAQEGKQLVLSVYSDNERAKRFYARYGMAEIGRNPFRVGSQIDDDRIWSVML